jgi:hypothetical protein
MNNNLKPIIADSTYSTTHKYEPIKSSMLNVEFFKKLYSILSQANEEAKEYEIKNLKRGEGQTDADFEKEKKSIGDLLKVTIHIYGVEGGFILTEDKDIFSEERLPNKVLKISLENYTKHNVTLNYMPRNKFQLNFDFSKAKIFDFITIPSYATKNDSYIDVLGENDSWVISTHAKTKELIDNYANKHSWLHKNSIYDAFLYFAILPLVFRVLFIIQAHLPSPIKHSSVFLKIPLFIYFFILLVNIFRTVFNYARWTYPYLEFSRTQKSISSIHRNFIKTIIVSLIVLSVVDVIKFIVISLK